MKPTDEERREVAARLRAQVKRLGPHMDAHEFAHYCADVIDRENALRWDQMTLHLADLIEPEERTCHMISDHLTDTAYCSVCGERFDSVAQYMAMVQLPYSVTDYEPEYKDARYCPSCGARVISGGAL